MAKVQQAAQELERAAKDAAGSTNASTDVTPVRIEEGTFKWSDYLWQGSLGALKFFGQLFVMLCLVYYLLVSGDLYKRKLVRIVGPSLSQKRITVQILDQIPQLHAIHPWLLMYRWQSFADLLRDPPYWHEIGRNLLLQAGYVAVFYTAAWARITSRDIT